MKVHNQNTNFKISITTKNTLFGVSASDFNITYSPLTDLISEVIVEGGLTEKIKSFAQNKATLSEDTRIGSTFILVEPNNTVKMGDVVCYNDKFAFIKFVLEDRIYVETFITSDMIKGYELTTVGNSGIYTTNDISIADAGDYLFIISAPKYRLYVETIIKIIDPQNPPLPTVEMPDISIPLITPLSINISNIDLPTIETPTITIEET